MRLGIIAINEILGINDMDNKDRFLKVCSLLDSVHDFNKKTGGYSSRDVISQKGGANYIDKMRFSILGMIAFNLNESNIYKAIENYFFMGAIKFDSKAAFRYPSEVHPEVPGTFSYMYISLNNIKTQKKKKTEAQCDEIYKFFEADYGIDYKRLKRIPLVVDLNVKFFSFIEGTEYSKNYMNIITQENVFDAAPKKNPYQPRLMAPFIAQTLFVEEPEKRTAKRRTSTINIIGNPPTYIY